MQRKLEPGKTQPIGLSSALPSRGEREGRERIPARRPGLPIWNSVGQQISNGALPATRHGCLCAAPLSVFAQLNSWDCTCHLLLKGGVCWGCIGADLYALFCGEQVAPQWRARCCSKTCRR